MSKVGDKVVFLYRIIEEATGDHPAFLMARSGERGVIEYIADKGFYHILVKPEHGLSFWCNENDFELVPGDPAHDHTAAQ